MAKDAEETSNEAEAEQAKPPRVYTAWHPLVVVAIEHTLPVGWFQCLSEFQLSREPQRIDIVIVRRVREGTPPPQRLLASVLSDLADHTLVHFKGPTDVLERDDAVMLLVYALQYLLVAEVTDPALVALRVVAPRTTPRFVKALKSLGCELTSQVPGIHEGRLCVFPLRVIETVPVSARAGERLLYTVTPQMLSDPDGFPAFDPEELEVFWALREHVEQLRHPHPNTPRRVMKDEDKVIDSFHQAMARLLERMSPEERLAGLAPEQVLRAYAPEQVLLALPDAMLQGFSEEALAMLPDATRDAIRKRVGRG